MFRVVVLFICFIFILSGCIIEKKNHNIKDVKIDYVSTEYIGNGDFRTILKSSKNLHDLYTIHKLFATHNIFECKINSADLGKITDGENEFYGLMEFVRESGNSFFYSVKYLAVNNYHLITVKEYINSIASKTDKLYCQYRAIFYETKEHFTSKMFEIDIKDFLDNKDVK